jgi:hypothetical protein
MESNVSIRNTRKGLPSQMILRFERNNLPAILTGSLYSSPSILSPGRPFGVPASLYLSKTIEIFVALCWTNEIKQYKEQQFDTRRLRLLRGRGTSLPGERMLQLEVAMAQFALKFGFYPTRPKSNRTIKGGGNSDAA